MKLQSPLWMKYASPKAKRWWKHRTGFDLDEPMESIFETHYTEFGEVGKKQVAYAKNICLWYDGTLRPMRGHKAKCRWQFDGAIWWHR